MSARVMRRRRAKIAARRAGRWRWVVHITVPDDYGRSRSLPWFYYFGGDRVIEGSQKFAMRCFDEALSADTTPDTPS